jgi:nitroimidazol reductase NimA-like FMN-containing flavoprotein (pyridoxamine 5'-phosphate oxidase superfamily)
MESGHAERTVTWPDEIDAILAGDHTMMLATVTPASGVVLLPVTNFVVRDREAAVSSAVNTSIGVGKKLERIRANPRVALAYHTREHGLSGRPEYVLVQGTASLTEPDPRYLDSLFARAEQQLSSPARGRYEDSLRERVDTFRAELPTGRLWDWWLREWHRRVGIDVAVERVIAWPDLGCRRPGEVHGAPLPDRDPEPQPAPARGSASRIDHRRAVRRAARLPHALLGWVGGDGLPVAAPVEIAGADERGILLAVGPGLVPPGGRRAGLTAHWFGRNDVGLRQRVHTGWLEVEPGGEELVYAPHTEAGFTIPRSRNAFWIAAGGGTRLRIAQPARLPSALRERLGRGRS